MERLKQFRNWILIVIGLYIFSSIIAYILTKPEEAGGKIYNATHKTESVNEAEEIKY